MRKILRTVLISSLGVVLLLSYNNCSKVMFNKIDAVEKADVIDDEIFEHETPPRPSLPEPKDPIAELPAPVTPVPPGPIAPTVPTVPEPKGPIAEIPVPTSPVPSEPIIPTQPIPKVPVPPVVSNPPATPTVPKAPTVVEVECKENESETSEIPVKYECTDYDYSDQYKPFGLKDAVRVELHVGNCVDDSIEVFKTLINEHKIVTKKCKNELELAKCGINELATARENGTVAKKQHAAVYLFGFNQAGQRSSLYKNTAWNFDDKIDGYLVEGSVSVFFNDKVDYQAGTQQGCDYVQTCPLFVQIPEKNKKAPKLKFSAPSDGVLFDIQGEKEGHLKSLISWANNETVYFLTKPNSTGEVLGVDELFGNTTKGPDNGFADDGFLALAKFDSNKDNVITSEDEVFSQLRLWNDKNQDGIGQRDELFKLSEKEVELIDLNYDKEFKENDKYGNTIKGKTVVRTTNKKLLVMYDVWFRVLPAKLKEIFQK